VAFLFAFLTAFVSFRHSASIPPRDRGHGFVIDHRGKVRISREIDEVFAPRIRLEVASRNSESTAPRAATPAAPADLPQPAVVPAVPDAVEESHETTDHGLPPEPAAELEGEVVVVEADDESVPASEELPTAEAAETSSDEATEVSSSASASSTNDQATPALPVSTASSRGGSAKSAEAVVTTSQTTAERPDWTNGPSGFGEDGIYRRVVVSDRWSTENECDKQLREKLIVAVAQSVGELMDAEFPYYMDEGNRTWAARSRLRDLDLSMSDIQKTMVAKRHLENYELAPVEGLEAIDLTMKRKFLLLEFDKSTQVDIEERWKAAEHRAQARDAEEALFVVCGLGAIVLAVLGLIYGLLRFDTATKGYYTKRLLIGVGAVTILFVLLAVLADGL
jgi:hypothetical protein